MTFLGPFPLPPVPPRTGTAGVLRVSAVCCGVPGPRRSPRSPGVGRERLLWSGTLQGFNTVRSHLELCTVETVLRGDAAGPVAGWAQRQARTTVVGASLRQQEPRMGRGGGPGPLARMCRPHTRCVLGVGDPTLGWRTVPRGRQQPVRPAVEEGPGQECPVGQCAVWQLSAGHRP